MTTCLGCGKQTSGSVGAAGLRWPNVCPSCKSAADAELHQQCVAVGKMTELFTSEILRVRTQEKSNQRETKCQSPTPMSPNN